MDPTEDATDQELSNYAQRKNEVFVGTEKEFLEYMAREKSKESKSPGWRVPRDQLYKSCTGDVEWCQIRGTQPDGQPARHYHTNSGKVIPLGADEKAPMDGGNLGRDHFIVMEPKETLRTFYQPPSLRVRLKIAWAWISGRRVEL